MSADPQPLKRGKGPAIWDLVMADMGARDKMGRAKYRRRLRAYDKRCNLQDAYQEALDLVVYLRKELYLREGS